MIQQQNEEVHGKLRHGRNERHELMIITQNGTAPLVVINARTHQAREGTQALLKLLAMGQRDIEQSRFRDAEDVFASITRLDLA